MLFIHDNLFHHYVLKFKVDADRINQLNLIRRLFGIFFS